ncbi:MAG: hypothetical protein ACI83W_000858 [Marinoscillum sp.]|jgi:hypothetical protein
MEAKKLYLVAGLLLVLGYGWLGFLTLRASNHAHGTSSSTTNVCLIKQTTGFPCPSCGTSRSVLALTDGNFQQAIMTNPFGLIVFTIMLILPFWMLFDLATKRTSMHTCYLKSEEVLRKKMIAIPLICMVLINWIWNINKGL